MDSKDHIDPNPTDSEIVYIPLEWANSGGFINQLKSSIISRIPQIQVMHLL
jgi:hypothetical protein